MEDTTVKVQATVQKSVADALEERARIERRSVSNLIAVILADWYEDTKEEDDVDGD